MHITWQVRMHMYIYIQFVCCKLGKISLQTCSHVFYTAYMYMYMYMYSTPSSTWYNLHTCIDLGVSL